MFYCNPCAKPRGWPESEFMRSYGPCEICGKTALCNDVPSRFLPIPPKEVRDATEQPGD